MLYLGANVQPHVYNEQVKMTATVCVNLATAAWVLAYLTPILNPDAKFSITGPIGGFIGTALFMLAMRMLRDLHKPSDL
jgi:hypothetical protein